LSLRRAALTLGVVLLVGVGAYAVISYFDARDDSTVSSSDGPGRERPAGERPVVKAGNVLLLYSDPQLAGPLRALQRDLAGGDEALAAAGQAVLVRRQPDLPVPVVALSARRRLDGSRAQLPALRDFVEYWLGRDGG
jgi:hypothetical protein